MKQFLISIDQVFNVVFGSGWADETFSSYAYRRKDMLHIWIDKIFFWAHDHCRKSYESERLRKQMPPELRDIIANLNH